MKPSQTKDRVVIVGAGITGMVSACRLAEEGYRVTVVEARDRCGDGASRANAGQLLFDRISALGSPGFLKSLPRTLIERDQGVSATRLFKPSNWRWSLSFLGQCRAEAWRRNTADMLALARQSRTGMHGFLARHAPTFDWRRPGKLILHATPASMVAARQTAEFQARFGGRHEAVDAARALQLEPALQGNARPIAGAIHLPDAEVGDCHAFCQALERLLVEKLGGEIRYGLRASGFARTGGRIAALNTGGGRIAGDVFVVSAGAAASDLLPRFPGRKPIVGVRGVSLTFPAGETPPDLSVTDAGGKFVVMRLGDRVRVTGFAGFDDHAAPREREIALLTRKARALMPAAADYDAVPFAWAGLRPQTPDDLPMIGRAGAENLFVNAGQGSLGWTFAFGSAERLVAAVAAV